MLADIKDIVKTVYDEHPKDCVFMDGAQGFIVNQIKDSLTKEEFLDKCQDAFKQAEIYCPHEGRI